MIDRTTKRDRRDKLRRNRWKISGRSLEHVINAVVKRGRKAQEKLSKSLGVLDKVPERVDNEAHGRDDDDPIGFEIGSTEKESEKS